MAGDLLKACELTDVIRLASDGKVTEELAAHLAKTILSTYEVIKKPPQQVGDVAKAARKGFYGT